jgi:serine/threonine protein phosphatase PrpC
VQLSVDDSAAQAQMEAGVPRAEAESSPQAHAITKWLGRDSHDHEPRVGQLVLGTPGWVLVCSDGLWNYSSDADDLAGLVHRVIGSVGTNPVLIASALVDWANEQGGQDNITAALARFDSVVPTPARPA